jgi:hypothetical protein
MLKNARHHTISNASVTLFFGPFYSSSGSHANPIQLLYECAQRMHSLYIYKARASVPLMRLLYRTTQGAGPERHLVCVGIRF